MQLEPTRICLTGGVQLERVNEHSVAALTEFLSEVDLTLSGLDAASVRLWIELNDDGQIIGSTGYELSDNHGHALIRSVAVRPSSRSAGKGSDLARFAFAQAHQEGARQAWLFSRRSGPFWQGLGFQPADKNELATVLATTHQVQLFQSTGQLAHEVAWSRPLP